MLYTVDDRVIIECLFCCAGFVPPGAGEKKGKKRMKGYRKAQERPEGEELADKMGEKNMRRWLPLEINLRKRLFPMCTELTT